LRNMKFCISVCSMMFSIVVAMDSDGWSPAKMAEEKREATYHCKEGNHEIMQFVSEARQRYIQAWQKLEIQEEKNELRFENLCSTRRQIFLDSDVGQSWRQDLKEMFPMPDVIYGAYAPLKFEIEKGKTIEFPEINQDNVVSIFERSMWQERKEIVNLWKVFKPMYDGVFPFPPRYSDAQRMTDAWFEDLECPIGYDEPWFYRDFLARCNDVMQVHHENFNYLSNQISEFYQTTRNMNKLLEITAELENWFWVDNGLKHMSGDAATQFAAVRQEMNDHLKLWQMLLSEAEEIHSGRPALKQRPN